MNFSSLKQNPNLICQIATSIGHMESNLTMHLVFLLESINTPWILPKCQHFEIFIMNTEMALKKKKYGSISHSVLEFNNNSSTWWFHIDSLSWSDWHYEQNYFLLIRCCRKCLWQRVGCCFIQHWAVHFFLGRYPVTSIILFEIILIFCGSNRE